MNAIFTRFSILSILLLCFLVQAKGQNLINNPSFETDLSDWVIGSWGGPTVIAESSADYAQDGSKAAKATIPTADVDAGKVFFRQQNLNLSTSSEYTLVFYALSNSDSEESIDLSIYSHTNMDGAAWGTAFSQPAITFQGDGAWHRFEYVFTPSALAGEPDFSKLALSFSLARNATTIYFDHFSLTTNDAVVPETPQNYFVSKTGDDNNTGAEDSPFLTITKAASLAKAGDVVTIGEGTYEETLTPQNSGTSTNPIVYQGAAGEKVIISAMQALSDWSLDEGNIYKTTVDWSLGQKNMVFNDDQIMTLARWPNDIDGDISTPNGIRNSGGSGSDEIFDAYLTYNEGIPSYNWEDGGSIWFYGNKGGGGWIAWKSWIKASTSTQVNFELNKSPDWIRTWHDPASLGYFFLEGIKEAIDIDNEWYFNESTKTLYLQVDGGTVPLDGQISMRKRELTINLYNKSYIEIKNLAVTGGRIDITGSASNNLIYQVTSTFGNHTRGVVDQGFNSGSQSIMITGSSNTIEQCEIAYGAGNGIKAEGNGHKILNNHVHHFNTLGCYDAVLSLRGGSNTIVKNNTLHHAGRDIINANHTNAEYAYNDISYGNGIVDDCALYYTTGGPQYVEIHHNYFHDNYGAPGAHGKAAGIYLDNDAEAFDVHHNVVSNTEWTNIQINWDGKDLNIYNNTLWNGSATMGAWHKDGTQFYNVNVWNNLSDKSDWEEQSDKQNNLTISSGNPFTDIEAGDFTLKANTQPIDFGREIDGFTDGFVGASPDAGAYEYGATEWTTGINWDPELGPAGLGCYGLPGDYCSSNPDPSETDSDGVMDDVDECPNTEAGVEVDEKGCAINASVDDLYAAGMRLYPNPVNGAQIFIEASEMSMSDMNYTIYNASGAIVNNGTLPAASLKSTIMVDEIPAGIYVIVLSNKEIRVGTRFVKL
ncbi:carbohydrate binding domain-containing protein [Saccharicrinis aurantiacus]|uniref:carbohydrate binding domain-containing protein n=1 Tax=Saccharicrinis aurantiacus TaxID=1849719 RepID=UPI00094FF849|nr:carbohydrate binding domain-containing protein [Saccharicrinis aurantiacus]